MKSNCLKLFIFATALLGQNNLQAQSIQYSTLSGDTVDETAEQNCEDSAPQRYCRWREQRDNDRFAEEQFEDTGWPSRRDDELSDQLMR